MPYRAATSCHPIDSLELCSSQWQSWAKRIWMQYRRLALSLRSPTVYRRPCWASRCSAPTYFMAILYGVSTKVSAIRGEPFLEKIRQSSNFPGIATALLSVGTVKSRSLGRHFFAPGSIRPGRCGKRSVAIERSMIAINAPVSPPTISQPNSRPLISISTTCKM